MELLILFLLAYALLMTVLYLSEIQLRKRSYILMLHLLDNLESSLKRQRRRMDSQLRPG